MTQRQPKHASPIAQQHLLATVGEALYGPQWLAHAAAGIGVSPPAIHAMKEGHKPVSARVWSGVQEQATRRVTLLDELLALDWMAEARQSKHAFLNRVGVALYCSRWNPIMAAELAALDPTFFRNESRSAEEGVGPAAGKRKIYRMAAGDQPIPPEFWRLLRRLVVKRRAAIVALQPALEGAVTAKHALAA